ncbi:hypothetical protein BATDEDRAFT_87989 [Batrachochytrium dendrobatidis JAM81]|uniref:isopentenyl-diphosphate Delta-isomerase n=2 Tax=Batrachochytrium dendrobatidis TaxID=109871 RepID=F4P1J2_BATDJ|nr:isopentenyl-diphosphate delta-isomerase IDI1 [Batrachochytrium dendrobatidis JAM81]EGF80656.1 hypothetical protein BATDEDRAFT_87989 [Batrachochytrium dendrobatidis JAM81]OAJ41605.1 isopentenyl-diphosphate delta-isomerase [Batrachochytrium dendrobatidis JEL423]|eukprot:XP_006678649.1 hypothetical protein BATDEDRAFT_87989 [Batrachochytrium dendrobatidis JAM81]
MTTASKDIGWESYDPEQIRLMSEQCIVVDRNDVPIRGGSKKECHLMENIDNGLLHRAFSVFIFSEDGRLLLQQRADEKITFPGYFTNTCCSHPLMIQDEMEEEQQMGARRAAQRKLMHEMGIEPHQVPLDKIHFLTRIHYLAPSDGLWGEHEIDYIFIFQGPVTVNANPNEVKSFRYVTKDELKTMFETAADTGIQITPWFKLIVETFLYKWWDNLDKLSAMKDAATIHRL